MSLPPSSTCLPLQQKKKRKRRRRPIKHAFLHPCVSGQGLQLQETRQYHPCSGKWCLPPQVDGCMGALRGCSLRGAGAAASLHQGVESSRFVILIYSLSLSLSIPVSGCLLTVLHLAAPSSRDSVASAPFPSLVQSQCCSFFHPQLLQEYLWWWWWFATPWR